MTRSGTVQPWLSVPLWPAPKPKRSNRHKVWLMEILYLLQAHSYIGTVNTTLQLYQSHTCWIISDEKKQFTYASYNPFECCLALLWQCSHEHSKQWLHIHINYRSHASLLYFDLYILLGEFMIIQVGVYPHSKGDLVSTIPAVNGVVHVLIEYHY